MSLYANSPAERSDRTAGAATATEILNLSSESEKPPLWNSLSWDMQDRTMRRAFFTQTANTVGTVLTLVSSRGPEANPSQLGFDTETLQGLEQATLG